MKQKYVFKNGNFSTKLFNFRVDKDLMGLIDQWIEQNPRQTVSELIRISVRSYLTKNDSSLLVESMKMSLSMVVQRILDEAIGHVLKKEAVNDEHMISLIRSMVNWMEK